MDLVETVLRGCNALEYCANFKDNKIVYNDLKLLSREDLLYLGITDELLQNGILKHCRNLQNFRESKKDLAINCEYICLIINQICVQLIRHLANMSCTLKREHIDLCPINLKGVSFCLQDSMIFLDENIEHLENSISNDGKDRCFILPYTKLIGGIAAAILLSYRYFKKV